MQPGVKKNEKNDSRYCWTATFKAGFAGLLLEKDFDSMLLRGRTEARHVRGYWRDVLPSLDLVKDSIRCITADASSSSSEEFGVDALFAEFVCPYCECTELLNAQGFRVALGADDFDTYWEKEDFSDSDSLCVNIAAVPPRPDTRRWIALDSCPSATLPFCSGDALPDLQKRMRQRALSFEAASGLQPFSVTVGNPGPFRGVYECPACGSLFTVSLAAAPTAILPTSAGLVVAETKPASVAGRLEVCVDQAFLELANISKPSIRISFRYNEPLAEGSVERDRDGEQFDPAFEAVRNLLFMEDGAPLGGFIAGREIDCIRERRPLLEKAFECWSSYVYGLPF